MLVDNDNDVLIIDDDTDIVDVLQDYCEEAGFFRNIINATDGSIASNKLLNQKFSLILLDLNMPKKSGVDILKDFSRFKLNKISNIIVISGEIDKEVLTLAARLGVKHFLVKPFDIDNFINKVSKVVGL